MSILDLTLREMLPTARHAAFMAYARLRNRAWRAVRRAWPDPPPARQRPVRTRFVGARRDGSDLWMDTELPGSMTFPVMIGNATPSFIAADRLVPLPHAPMMFGARVFYLHRITRADHLGPTEAEYREVLHGEAEAAAHDAFIEALAERTDREIMGRNR